MCRSICESYTMWPSPGQPIGAEAYPMPNTYEDSPCQEINYPFPLRKAMRTNPGSSWTMMRPAI